MNSQNDKYHGDEHITDKPFKYVVKASEVVHYEVEVDAYSEDEAYDLAIDEMTKNGINVETIKDSSSFQVDSIREKLPDWNYNYTLGEEV